MKNSGISVIVPVYNVADYLTDCIYSLKSQKLDALEFILIDDGSPDMSPVLCEEAVLEDDRFCVIHKMNGGVSEARNLGISICESDYIAFVDSDDCVTGQPFEYALELAKGTKSDIVCMDYTSDNENNLSLKSYDIKEYKALQLYDMLCRRVFWESVWNKLFDRNLFEKQLFDTGVLNEDFLFFAKLLKNDVKVVVSNYKGYFYRLHSGSITGSGFKKNMIDALYNAHYAWKNVPYTECVPAAEEYFLYKIFMFLINMPKSYIRDNNSDYSFAIKHLIELKDRISFTALSKRDKILLKSFSCSPLLTKVLVDFLMKMKG